MKKSVSGVARHFVHDDAGHLLGEYDATGAALEEYVWLGDTPVALVSRQVGPAGVEDDLDIDAVPDVVLRHQTGGDTFAWLLNPDHTVRASAPIGVIDAAWDLAGMADFGSDGKLDLVLRHIASGQAYVWHMNGTQFVASAFLFPMDPAWKVAALADFNGDGRTDVLLRHKDTGEAWVLFYDGTQYLSSGYFFTLDPLWKVAGTGDFGGDGRADLVLRHKDTGAVVVWTLNGMQVASSDYYFTVDPLWDLVRVADYDRDGKPDMVFRERSTGIAGVWYLDGPVVNGSAFLYSAEPAWQQGPAGEAFQKATGAPRTAPVNRPIPAGTAKPELRRLALTPPAPRIVAEPLRTRPPSPADYRGPILAGPEPPPAKSRAKNIQLAGSSAIYYLWPDHLNTPRAITRPKDHRVVWRWESLPFGETYPEENPSGLGPLTFNLRFPGQYFDQETGVHQNWKREYAPSFGRYTQYDPIGLSAGMNPYGYAAENPISLADRTGLIFCSYSISSGMMECLSNDGNRFWSGRFTSGNNNEEGCRDNPICDAIAFVGPAPRTCYKWGPPGSSGKADGRRLEPIDPADTFGRDLLATHSCRNPWGPNAGQGAAPCSAGCIVSNQATAQSLNRFMDSDSGNSYVCVGQ